jgi:hypothetical protein
MMLWRLVGLPAHQPVLIPTFWLLRHLTQAPREVREPNPTPIAQAAS